jgi:hypothetical protein
MMPIVDVSDTSMAASGTTKRISINNILACSPSATLASATISGALDAARLNVTGATIPANGVYLGSANNLSFSAASTLAMTLNSTGLGVGVASPAYKLDVNSGAPASAANFKSTGSSVIARFADGTADTGYVGSGAALISGGARTDYGILSVGSLILGANNARSVTVDTSGNVLVGTTSASGNAGGLKLSNVAGNLGQITFSNNSGSADYVARFNWGSTPTLVGNITVSSGGTAFNTTSDYRLKESVQPLVGGLARVNALKPSIYKWKTDGSNGEGFLAHELAESVPLAVTGKKDAVNEDGSIKPQGVDLSKVVPILVAAIQELTARVQTLEAK